MADSYIEDKMAKVRAAKKPAEYKNIHPAVKDLDDDHPTSLKIVKEWERHNRTLIKELRYKWRRMEKGKEKDKVQREIRNREDYLNSIKSYLGTAVWRDLFWGKDMENKTHFVCLATAYDVDGIQKKTPRTRYTRRLFIEDNVV